MSAMMSPFTLLSERHDVYQLPRSEIVVGRSEAADIELDEVVAARQHCVIDWDEKREIHLLTVIALNGIYLNSEFLARSKIPCDLRVGDEIRIGENTFIYSHSTETDELID